MKTTKLLLIVIALSMLVWSCEEDAPETPATSVNEKIEPTDNESLVDQKNTIDEEALIKELSADAPNLTSLRHRGIKITEAPVLRAEDLQPVGMSYLVRLRQHVLTVLKSNDLEPSTATTLWWVFFNAPEQCEDGCDINDLPNPAVQADVLYADGRVIRANGKTVYVSHRKINDSDESVASVLWGGSAIGIESTRDTEVHLVVRSHGPVIPGLEREMITTFNGGCTGFPPEAGEPGPNTCVDIQFTVHKP